MLCAAALSTAVAPAAAAAPDGGAQGSDAQTPLQVRRSMRSGYPDVLIYPSTVIFQDIVIEEKGERLVERIEVSLAAAVKTKSAAGAEVLEMTATLMREDGRRRDFRLNINNESGRWEGAVRPLELDDPGRSHKKQHKMESKIYFRALDSLGNVTAEIPAYSTGTEYVDARRTPLVDDPSEKGWSTEDYRKSWDRDITETSTVVIGDALFFDLRVSGDTHPYYTIEPGMNFYILRLIPSGTSDMDCRLGRGMYHYYSNYNYTFAERPTKITTGKPFMLDYQVRNILELSSFMKQLAEQGQDVPKEFEDLYDMLEERGTEGAPEGSNPILPSRRPVDDSGIEADFYDKHVYWKVPFDALGRTGDGENAAGPAGLRVRFYTKFARDENASTTAPGDRTVYSTLFFSGHTVGGGGND